MRFQVENLGFIDKGEIELNNITVICGENNVGKTYLSYSIYGFFYLLFQLVEFEVDEEDINNLYDNKFTTIDLKKYENKVENALVEVSAKYSKKLVEIFNSSQDFFSSSKFSVTQIKTLIDYKNKYEFNAEEVSKNYEFLSSKVENSSLLEASVLGDTKTHFTKESVKMNISWTLFDFFIEKLFAPDPFIITSERTGASLFYKELDINRSNLIENITKDINNKNILDKINTKVSRHSIPLKENIKYIRDFDLFYKHKSFIFHPENRSIFKNWEKLLGGKFESLNNEIYFIPEKENKRDKINPIPIYMVSSSSKSLFLLDLFIKSIAQPNQLLIIDEPELNLHPSKQIYMARILAQLSNMGIKILITTHSDFMIKEFNNLIMLSNKFKNKEKIMKKYKYDESEVLTPENISFYVASKDHTIKKLEVTNKGVDLDTFNEVIIDINERSDEIYYSLD